MIIVNTKKDIETAAKKLFAANGFQATSIRDIAQVAGVNSSMISYYFKSKEELLVTILKRGLFKLQHSLVRLSRQRECETEKLYHLIDFWTSGIFSHHEFVLLIIREQSLNSCGASSILIQELNALQYAFFDQLIRAGIEQGAFKSDIKPRMVFHNLVGTLWQVIMDYQISSPKDKVSNDKLEGVLAETNSYLKSLVKQQLLLQQAAINL